MIKFLLRLFAAVVVCVASGHANAYVECAYTVYAVYVDSNQVFAEWNGGQSAQAPLTDPAAKLYYASLNTAFVAGRTVVARYADGASCTAMPTQTLIGMWLR